MNIMAAHALLVIYLSQGYLHAGRIQDATEQAERALADARLPDMQRLVIRVSEWLQTGEHTQAHRHVCCTNYHVVEGAAIR